MHVVHIAAFYVFWGSAALIVYTYLVYPILLVVLAWLRRAALPPSDVRDSDLPQVSVLIVAHHENLSSGVARTSWRSTNQGKLASSLPPMRAAMPRSIS